MRSLNRGQVTYKVSLESKYASLGSRTSLVQEEDLDAVTSSQWDSQMYMLTPEGKPCSSSPATQTTVHG